MLISIAIVSCGHNKSLSNFSKRKYFERFTSKDLAPEETNQQLYASTDSIIPIEPRISHNNLDTIVFVDGKIISGEITKVTESHLFYYEYIKNKNGDVRKRKIRDFVSKNNIGYYTLNGKRYDLNDVVNPNINGTDKEGRTTGLIKITPNLNQLDTIVSFDKDTILGNVYKVSKNNIYFTQKRLPRAKYLGGDGHFKRRKKIEYLHIDGESYNKNSIDSKWGKHDKRRNRSLAGKIMLTLLFIIGGIVAIAMLLLLVLQFLPPLEI